MVNDCSSDNSFSVINEHIKGEENYTLIDLKENKGPAKARNTGIEKATGEYLFFLDSDDYFLEGINVLLENLNGDVIYVGFKMNDNKVLFKKDENGVIRCIRREFLGKTRYPDLRYGEDVELYKEVMKKNPTKNFTKILVWHYNYPRIGSLCWESIHGVKKWLSCR